MINAQYIVAQLSRENYKAFQKAVWREKAIIGVRFTQATDFTIINQEKFQKLNNMQIIPMEKVSMCEQMDDVNK